MGASSPGTDVSDLGREGVAWVEARQCGNAAFKTLDGRARGDPRHSCGQLRKGLEAQQKNSETNKTKQKQPTKKTSKDLVC